METKIIVDKNTLMERGFWNNESNAPQFSSLRPEIFVGVLRSGPCVFNNYYLSRDEIMLQISANSYNNSELARTFAREICGEPEKPVVAVPENPDSETNSQGKGFFTKVALSFIGLMSR